tara:strand:+ start:492 stop:1031 length:540 start_codon:yes stop_codon:yes gene_type:complete
MKKSESKTEAELLEYINENFHHGDIETHGKFYYKVRGTGRQMGKEAGRTNYSSGYRQLRVYNIEYQSHRMVYLWVHKKFPDNQIDHIDHNKLNNNPINLRDVTHTENHKNVSMQKNNTSGTMGVVKVKTGKNYYWRSSVRINSKLTCKCFPFTDQGKKDCIEHTNKVYIINGFHPNHGV